MTLDRIVTPTVPVAAPRERQFVHIDSFRNGIRDQVMTFRDHPPMRVVGGSA